MKRNIGAIEHDLNLDKSTFFNLEVSPQGNIMFDSNLENEMLQLIRKTSTRQEPKISMKLFSYLYKMATYNSEMKSQFATLHSIIKKAAIFEGVDNITATLKNRIKREINILNDRLTKIYLEDIDRWKLTHHFYITYHKLKGYELLVTPLNIFTSELMKNYEKILLFKEKEAEGFEGLCVLITHEKDIPIYSMLLFNDIEINDSPYQKWLKIYKKTLLRYKNILTLSFLQNDFYISKRIVYEQILREILGQGYI